MARSIRPIGHDDRRTTIEEIRDVVLTQRGNEQRFSLVVVKTQRLAQIGVRMVPRIPPLRHSNHPQSTTRGAKLVHMTLRRQGMRSHPPRQAITFFEVFMPILIRP